jgi:hypothetical protein
MSSYFSVVPSDTVPLAHTLTRLYVGGAGDITVLGYHDTAPVTFTDVPAGWFQLPVPITQILATGTTAGNLVSGGYA